MCFSAGASFTAAAALSGASIVSLKKAAHTRMLSFALTPLFFGIQQFCEGVVWITLSEPISWLHYTAIHSFIFFAGSWWPFWIPYSLYTAENNVRRKKVLAGITCGGIVVALILFFTWNIPLTNVAVVNHHLHYPAGCSIFAIKNKMIENSISTGLAVAYCFITIAPLFISTLLYAWVLGIAISIWLAVSYIFYAMAFPSTWCFFAAISSMIICFIVQRNRNGY
jgi:hypothetical protein